MDATSTRADDGPNGLVDDIGDRIGDLRAHLAHAHPLRAEWLTELAPAELAAIHRRLHGRHVIPDPELVESHLVELRTDPEAPAVTALPLSDATRREDPLVWLPLRIADRVHSTDEPAHTDRGGCRACADVIEATVRALLELDDTPQRQLAALGSAHTALLHGLVAARSALAGLVSTDKHTGEDTGDDTGDDPTPEDAVPSVATTDVAAVLAIVDQLLDEAQ